MKKTLNFELVRTIVAISLAIMLAIIIIFCVSNQPINAIYKLFIGPFTNIRYLRDIVKLMIPLIFTGLSVLFMFRTKLFNLSTEGGFYAGALIASVIAILCPLPSIVHPIIIMFVAILVGGLVAFIPTILKLKFDANEVVSSLMLNYIIFYFGDFILKKYLQDKSVAHVTSLKFNQTALLPKVWSDIHLGIVIGIVLIIVSYIFLYKTRWGLMIRITGENNNFAKYSGINVFKIIVLAQCLGGAIAGLGGAVHIIGSSQRFNFAWRSGYGFDGIIIAIIARYNPKYVVVSTFILAYLRVGSDIMSRTTDVQNEVVAIIQGVIIILIASVGFLENYKKKLLLKEVTN